MPTPFAFRSMDEWTAVFEEQGLIVRHLETYRPVWPTTKTCSHMVLVVDRD